MSFSVNMSIDLRHYVSLSLSYSLVMGRGDLYPRHLIWRKPKSVNYLNYKTLGQNVFVLISLWFLIFLLIRKEFKEMVRNLIDHRFLLLRLFHFLFLMFMNLEIMVLLLFYKRALGQWTKSYFFEYFYGHNKFRNKGLTMIVKVIMFPMIYVFQK